MDSSYVRAIALLSSSNGVVMIMPILAAPILSRLYTPADYGALAQFMMITTVLGGIAPLQLDLGVVTEERDRDAELLVQVAICGAAALALLVAPIAVVLAMNVPAAGGWMFAIPAVVLATGTTTAISALGNRRRAFRDLALIGIIATATTVGVSLLGGWAHMGHDGLFLGYVCGQAIGLGLSLALFFGRWRVVPQPLTGRRIRMALFRNRGFLTWSLPAAFLDRANREGPTYALALLGDPASLGAYTRSRQLLLLPSRVLGGAIGRVFFQRATEDMRRAGSASRIWWRTFLLLLGIGGPAALVLALIAPQVFAIVLGSDWREAGEIARIIAPMILGSFICAPLASMFYIAGRQREDFLLNLLTMLLILGAGSATVMLSWNVRQSVAAFTAAYCVTYVIYLLRSYVLARGIGEAERTILNEDTDIITTEQS